MTTLEADCDDPRCLHPRSKHDGNRCRALDKIDVRDGMVTIPCECDGFWDENGPDVD